MMLTAAEKRSHFLNYLRYMFPAVLDLSLYSAYTMISGMVTSRWIGETAMGAVSVASPYISLIYAYALIFGVGGSTVISICLGRGDRENARKIFSMNMAFMGLTTAAIGLAAFVFTEPLARLLGASPENIAYVCEYLRVVTLFSLAFGGCYILSCMVKADGHPGTCLIGTISGSAVSFVLLFVLGKRLGLRGIALASCSAQVVITLIFLFHFFTKRSVLKFVRFRFSAREIIRILRYGFPDAISEGSSGIFVLIFNWIIYRLLGNSGIIIFSVINYMNLLTVQIMLGLTQGMQPLVSFSRGQNRPDLCRLYLKYALMVAGLVCGLLLLVSLFLTEPVVSRFISPDDPVLFSSAVRALRLFSAFYPLAGISVLSIGYFSAIEKPVFSQALSLYRGLLGILLSGILLASLFGDTGIWVAPAATEGVTVLAALLFFRLLTKKTDRAGS